ncbi:MAG: BatA domain-containing protein [Myxococcales bacterium]|nr:BatA domain-containing protein [Myxococcales bacterium]
MQFESPWLLLGMLGAAIPIVIHLINRKRARVVPFAAIDFLLRSNKRLARKLKLKQLILLLLRILLIAAIPFALARPYCIPDETPMRGERPPASVVFVIDNSLSTRYLHDGKTLLDAAVHKVQQIVEQLGAGSNVAFVTSARPATPLTNDLTVEPAQIADALSRVRPSANTGDMAAALRIAETILTTSTLPEKRIVLLTDLQATEWEGMEPPWAFDPPPPLEIVDISPKDEELNNAGITAVRVDRASETSPQHVRITAEVSAFGQRAFTGVVTLKLGDSVAENTVSIPPGTTVETSYLMKVKPGTLPTGAVSIPEDALPADNTRSFAASFLGSLTVLVLNGAPRTIPYRDEVFFLEKALRSADNDAQARLQVLVVKAEETTPQQIKLADVVILANVLSLSPENIVALEEMVDQGGGVLFTAGDNVTAEYGKMFEKLLPLPIREIKKVVDPNDPEAPIKALTVDSVMMAHPATRMFSNMRESSLLSTEFYTYLLLGTATNLDQGVNTLLSYRNGAPLLVERHKGRGRVALLTTTVDMDWGDLPIRSTFLPLIQQLVLYLGGRLSVGNPTDVLVGESVAVRVISGDTRIVIEAPDGKTTEVEHLGDVVEGAVHFDSTNLPGVYTVSRYRAESTTASVDAFAVNSPPQESTLAKMTVDNVLNALTANTDTQQKNLTVMLSRTDERRTNVWPYLLAGLFVLLMSEAILFVRG